MKKKFVKLAVSLLAIGMLLSIGTTFAAKPTGLPILARLSKYHRVNLLAPYPPPFLESIEVPTGESTFVIHGQVTGGAEGEIPEWLSWSEMTGRQKNEYLKTANFELKIDGNPVELRKFQWYNRQNDGMYVVYYAVLPPDTFTVGDVIEGFWSVEFDGTPYTFTATRTVTSI